MHLRRIITQQIYAPTIKSTITCKEKYNHIIIHLHKLMIAMNWQIFNRISITLTSEVYILFPSEGTEVRSGKEAARSGIIGEGKDCGDMVP